MYGARWLRRGMAAIDWAEDIWQAAHYRAGTAVFDGQKPGNALPAPCVGLASAAAFEPGHIST